MSEEKKESKIEPKKDLFLLDELLKNLDWPSWQKTAFLQFTGWKSGKSVDKKQFDTAIANFKKYYGGEK